MSSYKALVIEDSPECLQTDSEILDSLGHEYDLADCQQKARELLAKNEYSYVLLDMEIPVRPGAWPRIQNGMNLLEQILEVNTSRLTPVIVTTGHGKKDPELAVDVFRAGAVDFINKPYPPMGKTLEWAIKRALAKRTNGQQYIAEPKREPPGVPRPFGKGKLTFYPSRVELCGVRVCGSEAHDRARQVLNFLKRTNVHGRYPALTGQDLADLIGQGDEATTIAGVIRNFRMRVKRTMLTQANIEIHPGTDLIVNDGKHGYQLSSNVTVVESDSLVAPSEDKNASGSRKDRPSLDDPLPDETNDDTLAEWILSELRRTGQVHKQQLIDRSGRSNSTVRRALVRLRDDGKAVFEGSARNGYWRLA